MSILRNLSILGIIAMLFGCNTSNPYKKKEGIWLYDGSRVNTNDQKGFEPLNNRFGRDSERGYYRGSYVDNSDGKTFAAVNDHYAKDKRAVYFCDTYRKGQEYYFYKYNRTVEVEGADPASFRFLKDAYGYMRDDRHLFYNGRFFPVKDINTFRTLGSSFDADDISAYYNQVEIKGSDGKTFRVLDNYYSKDTNHVYFSDMGNGAEGMGESFPTFMVKDASPATFELLADNYAKDSKQLYFSGKPVTGNLNGLEILGSGYAKNSQQVFYYGKPLQGADAASFALLSPADNNTDAFDKKGKFLDGRRVKL